jgi:hypothetical protein
MKKLLLLGLFLPLWAYAGVKLSCPGFDVDTAKWVSAVGPASVIDALNENKILFPDSKQITLELIGENMYVLVGEESYLYEDSENAYTKKVSGKDFGKYEADVNASISVYELTEGKYYVRFVTGFTGYLKNTKEGSLASTFSQFSFIVDSGHLNCNVVK